MKVTHLGEIWVASRTFFSAGTYLFNLGTTIYAMVKYCKEYIKYNGLCDVPCPNFSCGDKSYLCLGAFDAKVIMILAFALFILAHTVNAFLFAFKFDKGESPIKSAYFLPLMQLFRLVNLVKETWSCRGFKNFSSEEKNTLFTQLNLSLEAFPMYGLQIYGWELKLKEYVKGSAMLAGIRTLPISTASTFLSSFVFGGLTVQATAKNITSLKLKFTIGICSGICILAAAYLRYSSIIHIYYHYSAIDRIKIYQGGKGSKHSIIVKLLPSLLKWVCYTVFFYIFLSKEEKTTCRGFIKATVLAYISNNVGPLYALVSEALEQNQLGTSHLRIKLLVVGLVNIIMDCLLVPHILLFISRADFIVPAGVYYVSIIVYVVVDKISGRPVEMTSQPSRLEQSTELHISRSIVNGPRICVSIPIDYSIPDSEKLKSKNYCKKSTLNLLNGPELASMFPNNHTFSSANPSSQTSTSVPPTCTTQALKTPLVSSLPQMSSLPMSSDEVSRAILPFTAHVTTSCVQDIVAPNMVVVASHAMEESHFAKTEAPAASSTMVSFVFNAVGSARCTGQVKGHGDGWTHVPRKSRSSRW